MKSLLLAIQFLIAQRFSIRVQEYIFYNQHVYDINLIVDNETLIDNIFGISPSVFHGKSKKFIFEKRRQREKINDFHFRRLGNE